MAPRSHNEQADYAHSRLKRPYGTPRASRQEIVVPRLPAVHNKPIGFSPKSDLFGETMNGRHALLEKNRKHPALSWIATAAVSFVILFLTWAH